MQKMMKEALRNYPGYIKEANLLRQCAPREKTHENQALHIAETRVLLLETCLEFLDSQERFVIQKRFIEGLTWTQVEQAYTEQYNNVALATRTLAAYQTRALKKIMQFAEQHRDIILRVFSTSTAA